MFYNYLCNHIAKHINCDKVCQRLATGQWFSPGTRVSSSNKTDRHDIAEILLKCGVKQHKSNIPKTYKLSWLHKLLQPLHFGYVIYKNMGSHSLYLSKEDVEIIEEKVNSFWKDIFKTFQRLKRRN